MGVPDVDDESDEIKRSAVKTRDRTVITTSNYV